MNERLLSFLAQPPELYVPSTAPFWDDDHISMNMLTAHLDPEWDAATRPHEFVRRSAAWIAGLCEPCHGKRLLDLGCGPGIYAELFTKEGFSVTGVDLSRRSIAYAREHAEKGGLDIDYVLSSYLDITYEGEFDVAAIIYCDYGVLSPADRRTLLANAIRALRPGGLFILDGLIARAYDDYTEGRTTEYCDGGFWSPEPHLCIQTNRIYRQTDNYLDQYVIITKDRVECYNTWNQIFSEETLGGELQAAGFGDVRFYADVCGAPANDASRTLCAVCRKP